MKKIVVVISNHDKLGDTGKETGSYFPEVVDPYDVFKSHGYDVDFVSPAGGKAAIYGDPKTPSHEKFKKDQSTMSLLDTTHKPSDLKASDYAAIFYAGGHGTMWDFPGSKDLATLGAEIYENGGVVAALCHGPSGLINLKLSDGSYLVANKDVNSFTNDEEAEQELTEVVPFLLESKLIERGAHFQKSPQWQPHVVADQRLVTGQNPRSARPLAEAVVSLIQ